MNPLTLFYSYGVLFTFIVRSSAVQQTTTTTLPPFLLDYEYFHDGTSASSFTTCRTPLSWRKAPLHALRVRVCELSLSTAERKMFSLPTQHGRRLICISREMCTHHCGDERPGCVYTGDCRFQTCFVERDGLPAIVFEATHEGPKSVLIPVSAFQGNWSHVSIKPSYQVADSAPSTAHLESEMVPFSNDPSMRMSTLIQDVCRRDSSEEASEGATAETSPNSNETDDMMSATTPPSDAAQQISSSPAGTQSADAQEAESNSQSEVPNSSAERPNATQTGSTSSSGLSANESNAPTNSKEPQTIWTWLGPVLGLLGAVLAAIAAIAAACITRKGFWTDFSDNFAVQNKL